MQQLALTLCADSACGHGCKSWTATPGTCARGSNATGWLSTKVTSSASSPVLQFFQDSRTSQPCAPAGYLPLGDIYLDTDGDCHAMLKFKGFSSYTASAQYGATMPLPVLILIVVFGGALPLCLLILCCLCWCRRRRLQPQQTLLPPAVEWASAQSPPPVTYVVPQPQAFYAAPAQAYSVQAQAAPVYLPAPQGYYVGPAQAPQYGYATPLPPQQLPRYAPSQPTQAQQQYVAQQYDAQRY